MIHFPAFSFGLRLCFTLAVVFWAACVYLTYRRNIHANRQFGEQHGCQPVQKRLSYKWPFALDILKYQYDAFLRGNLLAYQADYFQQCETGQTFEVKLLGRVGYFTMSPKNLEAMLQTRFEDWELGKSRNALLPMIGNGIFTQDGHAWKHSREIMRQQFARVQYRDTKVFEGPTNDLLSNLQSYTGVVDLQPAFFRFTLAITTSLLFGEPLEESKHLDHEIFGQSFDYTSLVSAIRMRLGDWFWIYSPSRYRKACGVIHEYATTYVNHALRDLKENGESEAIQRHPFILDLFKELRDPKLVRDQLLNVLIAGRDTTACLMSWACYQLVRHPASLERVHREIQCFAGEEKPLTRAQINKMSYLRCVLNETNRLYTQIPVNIRIAKRTTCLPTGGGRDGESPLLVTKGTGVAFSAYHMHRNKEIYGQDAEEFRPERWEGPELKRLGCAFMPFHAGPRLCLGKDFALAEASYGLVRLLQAFPGLRKAPNTPKVIPGREKQNLTIVVSSAEGCKVLLH